MLAVKREAPEWSIERWLNTPVPLRLADFRGRVVVLHAFQMLCSGCVRHSLPQIARVAEVFADAPVQIIGVHTVFENHRAMSPTALEAFVLQNGINYPVGIDADGPDGIPQTMRRYDMQGTPTLVLIDAAGKIRRQVFGFHQDLLLGAELASLVGEVSLSGH